MRNSRLSIVPLLLFTAALFPGAGIHGRTLTLEDYVEERQSIEQISSAAAGTTCDLIADWSSNESDATTSVAWGDWDRDGDLDLAVGNMAQPNHLYRNDGGTLTLAWSSQESDATTSVAWGDWDGDGDLDLAFASTKNSSFNAATRIYRNDNGTLVLAWTATDSSSSSLAWGDLDGDDDLDLVVGKGDYLNSNGTKEQDRVYINTGGVIYQFVAGSRRN